MLFNLTAEKVVGDPDGMTIDSEENLWVGCFNSNHVSVHTRLAHYGGRFFSSPKQSVSWFVCFFFFFGAQMLKINSNTGELLTTVEFPAFQVTSASFGGANLDELYVTTAGYQLTEAQKAEKPNSGAMFCVTKTGSTGFASVSVKIPSDPVN